MKQQRRFTDDERRTRLAVRHCLAPVAYRAALFDTAGNAGPTIWAGGRIVGGWAVLTSGEVLTRLLEDPGREALDSIEVDRARLTTWLGAAGAVPRFATPLAKELVRQGAGGQTGG